MANKKQYNHAYTIAFEVPGSTHPKGDDVTNEMIVAALRARADSIEKEDNAIECCGAPFDTYEEDQPESERSSSTRERD